MIAFLRGRIHDKQPNRIVVDVAGVGYDVTVPLSTFYGLGDHGSEIALRIHTHVREDAIALFGFATRLGCFSISEPLSNAITVDSRATTAATIAA